MIEYALLIMLGFCIGGLIAFLLAPTLWHRAVRLTTKRLESTMPMSLSEIEADKDLLRASYAVRIRRLETGLNKARDKSANQLVEISKLQMQIGELNGEITALNALLDERRNAANVFENTIRKRFPELEGMVETAKAALDDRAYQIESLNNQLHRREEMLSMTQQAANLQQNEIRQLRETLDKSGSDTTGRFKRRPSQWTLDDYRSEYDRLNLELSKIREQLILAQERESRQTSVLKTELQQLAERIIASAAPQECPVTDWRGSEREEQVREERSQSRPSETATRRTTTGQSAVRSQPWRRDVGSETQTPSGDGGVSRGTSSESKASSGTRAEARAAPAPKGRPAASSSKGSATILAGSVAHQRADEPETVDQKDGQNAAQPATQNALKSLLNRRPAVAGSDLFGATTGEPSGVEAFEKISASVKGISENAASPNADPVEQKAGNGKAGPMPTAADGVETSSGAGASIKAEPKLDQVFREILEGRPISKTDTSAPAQTKDRAEDNTNEAAKEMMLESSKPRTAETSATKTLLDRLRIIQDRQTG